MSHDPKDYLEVAIFDIELDEIEALEYELDQEGR
jgi:hypothetical protein